MIRAMAGGLFATVALHAAADEPVLAISIDHAISRPNRNGRGIERPLFLILYKWRTDAPEVKARSFSGTLSAHCVRLPANGNQWKADIAYEAQVEIRFCIRRRASARTSHSGQTHTHAAQADSRSARRSADRRAG